MEQQTQGQQPAEQVFPTAPAKKSNAWVWILVGCLTIIILTIAIVAALGWWGVRKVKNEINKAQPKVEEMQKNAADWQRQAEQMQKQARDMQKNLPQSDNSASFDFNGDDVPAPY